MSVDQVTGPLTVGQLASRAGVRTDTIRYYERAGLLPVPRRTEGEHRRYGRSAFTGLVNSFVVSLVGLIPKVNIGEPAVIAAVIGIVSTVRLQRGDRDGSVRPAGRRELRAVGGTTRKRAVTSSVELTAQEAQIAPLAADGLSNPEIATRLFLSPRTVQFHLRKVFIKLDIASRAQFSRVLSGN
jgi:DNA-binding CsgD family transcriptional regulator